MKKIMTFTVMVALFSLFILSDATAQCCGWGGNGMNQDAAVSPETLKKFNEETKGLQGQLIDKHALLKKEWLKDNPDPEAIATIRKATIDIQVEIQKVAKKLGLNNWFGACHMFQGNGYGGGSRCGMHR